MRAVSRFVAAVVLLGALRSPLLAQGRWITPEPPCDIKPGHFKVNGGILYLKTAAEKADQRPQQLEQARRVLTEAIVENGQDKNPAAWYYLGRYYVERSDAAGADSAFARTIALAPQCTQDIDGYRHRLWASTVNAGLAAWQENKDDSAVALFQLAGRLQPANPKAFAALADMYASRANHDSALVYYQRTAEVAGSDTAFAQDKRDALSRAVRILLARAHTDLGVQQSGRLRASIDSIERALAADSSVLARVIASSQSRRARGRRLAPADQQTFTKDSTTRAQAVAQARAARATLLQQVATESPRLQAAFAPAVQALRAYLAAYPGDVRAATDLATLLAQSGRATEAATVFDTVAAHAQSFDPEDLFAAGMRLVSERLYRPGTRALALALEQNPYRRDGLYSLGVGYYGLRDSTNLLPVAQRIVAIDPLNRSSLRLLAAAWDLQGKPDSTLKYLAQADSLLAVEVNVSSFISDSAGAALTVLAANLRSAPSKPFRLLLEFLDGRGHVVATEARDVAGIAPHENQQIDLKVSGKGIVGWRYRTS